MLPFLSIPVFQRICKKVLIDPAHNQIFSHPPRLKSLIHNFQFPCKIVLDLLWALFNDKMILI